MKNRKIIVSVILIALMGVTARFLWVSKDFSYAGTLESTRVDLSAQLPSTIAEVKIQEGDPVTLGQELVTLACEDVQIASQLANQNYNRTLKLFQTGTASQDNLDQVKNKKQETDLRLKWCSIVSPINGTVLSRYREPAEWVSPGIKLLTLANIQDIWTYIYVPEPEIAKLKVGMKLVGTVPEIKHKIFEGKIIKINSEAEFTPKNVQTQSERTRLVYGVKVSFLGANPDEILKPGMTIEIKL